MKIFERTSRGTVVTPQGMQTLAAIADVLRSRNNLINTAGAAACAQAHQKIFIRYMNTMLKPFITPFLDFFEKDFPDVILDVRRFEREPILQAIRNQEINAGFIALPRNLSELGEGLRFEQVCRSEIVLVCSPENELLNKERISLDDLKIQNYCTFNDESHDYIFSQLQYMCGPLPMVLRSDDSRAIHEAVVKLNAVCFSGTVLTPLPRGHTFDDLRTVSMSHLADDTFNMGCEAYDCRRGKERNEPG